MRRDEDVESDENFDSQDLAFVIPGLVGQHLEHTMSLLRGIISERTLQKPIGKQGLEANPSNTNRKTTSSCSRISVVAVAFWAGLKANRKTRLCKQVPQQPTGKQLVLVAVLP